MPSRASVPFELTGEAEVEAVLYDVLGRRLAALASGRFAAGRHALLFDASHLPAGVYVVRVVAGGAAVSCTVTLLR